MALKTRSREGRGKRWKKEEAESRPETAANDMGVFGLDEGDSRPPPSSFVKKTLLFNVAEAATNTLLF